MSTIVGLDDNKKISSTEIYDTGIKALQSDINKNIFAVKTFVVSGQTSEVGTFLANAPDDIKAHKNVQFLNAKVESDLNYFVRYYYWTGEYFALGISKYDFVNLVNGTVTVRIFVLVGLDNNE